jgi:hypothetical protein
VLNRALVKGGHHSSITSLGTGSSLVGGSPTLLSSFGSDLSSGSLAGHHHSLMKSLFGLQSAGIGGASLLTASNLLGSTSLSTPAHSSMEILRHGQSPQGGIVSDLTQQQDRWLAAFGHHNHGPGQ